MSKARLVVTAVVTEGRSQGEVARAYGVSQGRISRLVAQYRAKGEAAFEPRSRRPTVLQTVTVHGGGVGLGWDDEVVRALPARNPADIPRLADDIPC
jgi:Helix-turn-helix domain